MVLDGVMIDRVVAMVVGVGAPRLAALVKSVVVVVPGGQPECGNAQLLKIGQSLDDAAQVAAVPPPGPVPSIRLGRRSGRNVVSRVAVAETVRHDQVDD